MGNFLKVCENCEFRVEQIDIENNTENICVLTNKCVGLFCYCKYFKENSGENITKI